MLLGQQSFTHTLREHGGNGRDWLGGGGRDVLFPVYAKLTTAGCSFLKAFFFFVKLKELGREWGKMLTGGGKTGE